MTRRFTTLRLAALGLGFLLGVPGERALAQDYPTRPIQVIVPFGAGGGTDVNARTVGEVVSQQLGQRLVIEARPGANGAIGSAIVAKAAPDGYTLLFTAQSTYSLNPNLMKELPYDQIKDFVPVAAISDTPWILAVGEDSPFKSVDDVVRFGKANPGQLTAGFWQSTVLVTTVAFGNTAGIQLRRVPYKGAVEAYADLSAGRLHIAFADSAAVPMIESKKLRVLAMTSKNRSALFPDAPTLTELGYPVVSGSTAAVFAPAGTPRPIVEKLHAAFTKAVKESKFVQDRMKAVGQEPVTMTLGEVDQFVKTELVRWEKMIADAGLQKE